MVLEKTDLERDLGILISSDLKWGPQVSKATRTAQFVLSKVKNSFSYLELETLRPLYLALVRPHLEYAAVAWNPDLIQDSKKIENVQRWATKMCPKLKKITHESSLEKLKLTTKLETKKDRIDLIQFYKIIHGLDEVKWINEISCLEVGVNNGPVLRRHQHHYYRESKSCSPWSTSLLSLSMRTQ